MRFRSFVVLALLPAALPAQQHLAHQSAAHAPVPMASRPVRSAPVVTITYTDYAFDAPASIPAGVTTFRAVNRGKEIHHAVLVRFTDGKGLKDLLAHLQQSKGQGAFPAWAAMQGGTVLDAEVTIDMKAGNYAWICIVPSADGTPHIAKGMMREFTVTPAASKSALPKVDASITMQDYGWTFSAPLKAGKQTLKLTTAPGQPHELVMLKLVPGKTAKEAAIWAEKPEGPPPFTWAMGVSPMTAGTPNYWTVDLSAGTYALVCFIPDAKDGRPHLLHGMLQQIEVK